MTAKQINSEIEYRLAKWVAFHLLQQGIISIEEYEKACADFPQENTIGGPAACEEYAEHGVVSAFVHECRNVGIAAQEPQTFIQTEASNKF